MSRTAWATRLCNMPLLLLFLVAPAGLEPTAYGLGNRRSIQLSYGANALLLLLFSPLLTTM